MNLNLLKGYVLVILSGAVILAAAILVTLQWGNKTRFSLYGKNIDDANTLVVMVGSAVAGVVLLFMIKMMIRGMLALRRGHRQRLQAKPAKPPATSEKPTPPAQR
jgi:uncharacterized integral membrane protein